MRTHSFNDIDPTRLTKVTLQNSPTLHSEVYRLQRCGPPLSKTRRKQKKRHYLGVVTHVVHAVTSRSPH